MSIGAQSNMIHSTAGRLMTQSEWVSLMDSGQAGGGVVPSGGGSKGGKPKVLCSLESVFLPPEKLDDRKGALERRTTPADVIKC